MLKQKFQCRTEDELFSFTANPMRINQVAAAILTQHGVKFAEISDMDNNVMMIASYNPDRTSGKKFIFALPKAY